MRIRNAMSVLALGMIISSSGLAQTQTQTHAPTRPKFIEPRNRAYRSILEPMFRPQRIIITINK